MGGPLDAGTVLIGSLALGVAVDDTIHFTTVYHQHVLRGMSAREALEGTIRAVVPAILATTIMISVSFLALSLSDFTITRNLGLLTSAVMVVCLLADLSLLPSLLIASDSRSRGRM